MSWDDDKSYIGNQVMIAHRNARFLKAHYDGYRTNYTKNVWYWNGGGFPKQVLLKNRELAHSVKYQLGTHMLIHKLYKSYWSDWIKLDSIHLLINHRSYLDKESPIKEFGKYSFLYYLFRSFISIFLTNITFS